MKIYKSDWHLERVIWDFIVARGYNGKKQEAINLQERLIEYPVLKPEQKNLLAAGLEELGDDPGFVEYAKALRQYGKHRKKPRTLTEAVDEVVSRLLRDFQKAFPPIGSKSLEAGGMYGNVLEKGLARVYDPRLSSFLQPEYKEIGTWLTGYASLLDIVSKSGSEEKVRASEALGYLSAVKSLLIAYNNLYTIDRQNQDNMCLYPIPTWITRNVFWTIDRTREQLRTTHIKDRTLAGYKDVMIRWSYEMTENLLSHYYITIASIRYNNLEKSGFKLSDVEAVRREVKREIRAILKKGRNGIALKPREMAFFSGATTIYDLVKPAK